MDSCLMELKSVRQSNAGGTPWGKRWRGEEQGHLYDPNTEEILAQGKLGRVPAEALHGSGMNPSYLLILLIMSLVYISCLSVLCFFHFSPHCYIESLVKHSVAFRGNGGGASMHLSVHLSCWLSLSVTVIASLKVKSRFSAHLLHVSICLNRLMHLLGGSYMKGETTVSEALLKLQSTA